MSVLSRYRKSAVFLAASTFLTACAASDDVRDDPRGTGSESGSEVAPVPWSPDVPPLSTRVWRVGEWAPSEPPFPWLPGEDRERSRSVGSVTHGWLINAARIERPHPAVAVLPAQAARGFDYATDEMLELVVGAAEDVAGAYPGSVLYLGNFSARGGGDIPQSVSHNSGRDGDLAFYFLDEAGEPAEPPDLVPVGDNGTWVARDGSKYSFDVERNWKLIESLVERGRGSIQYIFVSDALRAMLLEHARESDADRDVIRHAATVLGQPGGALPHDDHFHVRIYCSAADVRSGCTDRGRKVPGYDSHAADRRDVIAAASKHLRADEAHVRVAAVRRLALLDARRRASKIAGRLDDDDARVRAAAVRALAQLERNESAIRERLPVEEDPRVRAEIVWALGDFGSAPATRALTSLLDEPMPVELVDGHPVDLRVIVADVLADAEDPEPVPALIALTDNDDSDVRARAHHALTMLTNHDPVVDGASHHEAWTAWWKEYRKQSRDRWLLAGFRAAGFEVSSLNLRNVWELTKPVLAADHLSYNAQRVLMRLSRRNPASLDWPKSDANFYWRRWFERRCKRLGCPEVPDGLSTLD